MTPEEKTILLGLVHMHHTTFLAVFRLCTLEFPIIPDKLRSVFEDVSDGFYTLEKAINNIKEVKSGGADPQTSVPGGTPVGTA